MYAVGVDGQTKKEVYYNKGEAKAAFKQKFYDKTKNDWDDRKLFKKVAGKYYPVELDYGSDDEDEPV